MDNEDLFDLYVIENDDTFSIERVYLSQIQDYIDLVRKKHSV